MTNIFFDTEFIETDGRIHLISIGLASEEGRELYLENAAAPWESATDWVKENVYPHLHWKDQCPWGLINHKIQDFLTPYTDDLVHFWAYNCAYDWVVMCQLFNGMMNLPSRVTNHCNDLHWLIEQRDWHREQAPSADLFGPPHHALNDAKWLREYYKRLQNF